MENERRKEEEGFTLVELIIVLIITVMLGALAMPQLVSPPKDVQEATSSGDLLGIRANGDEVTVTTDSVAAAADAAPTSGRNYSRNIGKYQSWRWYGRLPQ